MARQEVPDDPQPENSKYWKPKTGDATEGELIRSEKGNYGEQYVLLRKEGTEQVLPHDTHLMQKLRKVALKSYVWITMIGEKSVGQPKPMKVYKVEFDAEYRAPVQPGTVAPTKQLGQWEDLLTSLPAGQKLSKSEIHKAMQAKYPPGPERDAMAAAREAALKQILSVGFGKYPEKILEIDVGGMYQVV